MRIESSISNVQPFGVTRSTMLKMIDGFLSGIVRTTQEHLSGKHFRLRVTAAAILLCLFTSFPPYKWMAQQLSAAKFVGTRAMQWKVQHPLSPIPANLKDPALAVAQQGQASHVNKTELRLTLPLLGRLSRTGAWTVAVWNHLAGFGAFYLLASLAFDALGDSVGSALFVLGLGSTFFGAWFFNDYIYGDGVACFFMLVSIACRQPLFSAASLVVAAFCDERAIMAAPLLIFYLVVRFRQDSQQAQRRRSCAAIASGVLAWALLRWWLARTFQLSTGTTDMASLQIIRRHLSYFPCEPVQVFRASWTLLVVALLSLTSQRNWASAATLLSAFGIAIAPAFLVWDFDRSVGYTFVALLISLHFLRGAEEASRKYLAAILVANVLFSPPFKSIFRTVLWFV